MPVAVASRPAFGQRWVRHGFEAHTGDALQGRVSRHGVRREGRIGARGQHRAVGERCQHDAIGGADIPRCEPRPGTLRRANRLLPSRLCLADLRRDRPQLLCEPVDPGLQLFARRFLIRRREIQSRLEVARAIAERSALEVAVGKEGEKAEVVLLAEWIVLVVVALRARQRRAQPHRRGGVDAIDEDFVARLVRIDATLFVGHRVAVEAARDLLLSGGIGKHVAGDLLDGERVERHVAVQRVDDPVAVLPHRAAVVFFVAVGVRIAREVEPRARPSFAVVRRGEQSIHDPVVGVARGVGHERIEILWRRRQTGQIQRDAPKQRGPARLGSRRQFFCFKARQHEAVDRTADPFEPRDGGQLRARGFHIRPVLVDGCRL